MKIGKKILHTILIALCLTAFACLFAACGPDAPEDSAVNYTVTVLTDAETPAAGVSVQIAKGGASFEKKSTDANGKAEFKLAPDSYEVKLSKLPAHYSVPENAKLSVTADSRELTVTLEKSFVYTVKLVNPDGTPFYAEGVMVGICTLDGNCLQPVPLGEDGVAIVEADPGDYHVQLPELPAKYTFDKDNAGYYTGKNFSATDTEMTITVTTIEVVNTGAPMTEAQKKTYSEGTPAYNASFQRYVSYRVTKQLKANEVAYFCVDAEISGKYNIFTNNSVNYLANGTEFVAGANGNFLPPTLICEAGKPYYFKAINDGNRTATADFVITAPFSSYIAQTGKGGVLDVTVGKENTNAIIAFTPTEAGIYTVSVKGDASAALSISSFAQDEFIDGDPSDIRYGSNPSETFIAYTSVVRGGSGINLAIAAQAEAYPATLNVTIQKTAPISDSYTSVEVKETLSQYGNREGELYGVPMNGTAKLVYSTADKFYHLGTADGPVVVVNITGALDTSRFEAGCALAYMELVSGQLATYQFITRRANGEDTVDYAKFLRGFVEYDYTDGTHGPVPSVPKEITEQTYYAKYVNDDGVYPLTEELKVFLEKFYEANSAAFSWQIPQSVKAENAWLFPCYYYDDKTETDAIVKDYKFVSLVEEGKTYNVGDDYNGYCTAVADGLADGKLTGGSAILRVKKNGSFSVLPYSSEKESYDESNAYAVGTWTNSNGSYTFTCNKGTLTYANGALTYTDGDTTIVFKA